MNNAEWMIKQGKNFTKLICRVNFVTDKFEIYLDSKIIGEIGIDTISRNPILVWLDQEHKEPILDDAERRYLSAVIKPFRKHVQNIAKYRTYGNTEEYIIIQIDSSERVYFPHFKAGTMYKGMDLCKAYTLEELGL